MQYELASKWFVLDYVEDQSGGASTMQRDRLPAGCGAHIQNTHQYPTLTINCVPVWSTAIDPDLANVLGAWQKSTKKLEFMHAVCGQLWMEAYSRAYAAAWGL